MYKFRLMLSLHTGWSLSDINLLPLGEFNAYFALNVLNPYTYDAQSEREGLLIAETFNQRRKKQLKSWELFPYLKPGTPAWLSDPMVQKARNVIENITNMSKVTGQPPLLKNIYRKITEEIDIEISKKNPDLLKIKELKQLIN